MHATHIYKKKKRKFQYSKYVQSYCETHVQVPSHGMFAVIPLTSGNMHDTLQLEEREAHFAKWRLERVLVLLSLYWSEQDPVSMEKG